MLGFPGHSWNVSQPQTSVSVTEKDEAVKKIYHHRLFLFSKPWS